MKKLFTIFISVLFSISLISYNVKSENDVNSFVYRLYDLCLNRQADSGGLNYYVDRLYSGEFTAAQVVKNFYNSPEMKSLNLSDQEFIERCYKAMMDRTSDSGGMDYWKDILSNGVSRIYVVRGFVESPEFTNICNNYGVNKGVVGTDEARDQNYGITSFISRLYKNVLDRNAEADGLNYYCNSILSNPNRQKSEAVNIANNFFKAPEFLNKNLENEEFIKICYRTFLDREAEASGLQYYINELENGLSREDVISGFANSPEFTNIMANYGIVDIVIPEPTPAPDPSPSPSPGGNTYFIINKNSRIFHMEYCSSVKRMKEHNKIYSRGKTAQQLINEHYDPCDICHPENH